MAQSVVLAERIRKPGPWAWLIRDWTRRDTDHCELVVDGKWHSSLLWSGGVRRTIEQPAGEWRFTELPWADARRVLEFYEQTKDAPYDWLAIVGQIIRGRWHLLKAFMCSEWCAAALGLPQPESYDPGLLGDICRWLNDFFRSAKA